MKLNELYKNAAQEFSALPYLKLLGIGGAGWVLNDQYDQFKRNLEYAKAMRMAKEYEKAQQIAMQEGLV